MNRPDDLSTLLKGPFYIFPMAGTTPLVKAPEIDEKLLDTAKIASLLESNRIFNF